MANILSILIFLPVVGALITFLLPRNLNKVLKLNALFFSSITLLLAIYLYISSILIKPNWDPSKLWYQEKYLWIPRWNIYYFLGIDGLSLPLIVLAALLSLVSFIISWNIKKYLKEYLISFLVLETGIIGVFCAQDLFLFFVFWELVLLPMYFVIGIWGSEERYYAAIKFILFTLVGSLALLLGIIYLGATQHTFSIPELKGVYLPSILLTKFVFFLIFLGFAVKVPIVPLHTWLPLAHTEAPTAGSVILAGILLKMGTYGILRIIGGIFPELLFEFSSILVILAVINIVWGAIVSAQQEDLKKMIAYSSVSHMGYILLGIAGGIRDKLPEVTLEFTLGVKGAILQMVAHGLITPALFILVGVLYDRTHIRQIRAYSGISKLMPAYAAVMGICCLASLGLPGLAGFIAELLCFLGAFKQFPILTIIGITGIIITALYILTMYERVFMGELKFPQSTYSASELNKIVKDLDLRECISLFFLVLLIFAIGIYPNLILKVFLPKIFIPECGLYFPEL